MVVHFVLENSLEYHDSSEDENSNAEEDQADGLSLETPPLPFSAVKTTVCLVSSCTALHQITFLLRRSFCRSCSAFFVPLGVTLGTRYVTADSSAPQ